MPLGHLGHRGGGLAGGEHQQAPGWRRSRQVQWQALAGMRGGHRSLEQAFQKAAA
jgi:hypothetical protein